MEFHSTAMLEQIPIYNQASYLALYNDVGADTFVILLASLCDEIEMTSAAILQAVEGKNWEIIDNQAHTLKSTARTFGADRLGEACSVLEELAKSKPARTPHKDDIAALLTIAKETHIVFSALKG